MKHLKTFIRAATRIFTAIAVAASMTVGTAAIATTASAGPGDYSWQRDSLGRRIGGRAAEVRPGGRLGGDGRYNDSYGRPRLYGRNNDPYDTPSPSRYYYYGY